MNLSIKNVPEDLAARVRARAARNRRSLQGELLVILEESVNEGPAQGPMEVLRRLRELGLRTTPKSAQWIREDRDGRSRR
jgi:plasmid stability protein